MGARGRAGPPAKARRGVELIPEAELRGGHVDRQRRQLEQVPGPLESLLLDEGPGRHPDLLAEQVRQAGDGKVGRLGEVGDLDGAGEDAGDERGRPLATLMAASCSDRAGCVDGRISTMRSRFTTPEVED
jgi:hypothetical protein